MLPLHQLSFLEFHITSPATAAEATGDSAPAAQVWMLDEHVVCVGSSELHMC